MKFVNSKRNKTKKNSLSKSNSPAVRKRSSFRADFRQVEILLKIGKAVSSKAIKTSKALGLSITFMEKGVLYKEHPDGTREILNDENVNYQTVKSSESESLKSGAVLNVRKS